MTYNRAYIINVLNKAILINDNKAFIINAETENLHPLSGYEWSLISSLRPEYTEVNFTGLEDIKKTSHKYYGKAQALELALEIMDNNLSLDYRKGIAPILINILDNNLDIKSYVENRILSTLTPETFNPELAFSILSDLSPNMAGIYEDLNIKTKGFNAFYTLFKLNMNVEIEDQDIVELILTDSGTYAEFTKAIYEKSEMKYDSAIIKATLKLKEHNISVHPGLFIDIKSNLKKLYSISLSYDEVDSDAKDKDYLFEKENDPILNLINEYFENREKEHDKKLSKRGKSKKVIKYIPNTLDVVGTLKEWARKQIKKSDDAFLHEFKDVVIKQLNSSSPEQLCKTCCDMAAYFIQIKRFSLAEKLLRYAKRLNSEDPVVYSQEAELYNKLGDLKHSLQLYNFAIQKFGNNVVAYNGKAETLRDMGKFADALKQYDDTIQKFDNVFAYTGKAETLRDMGKFADALKQYDNTIEKFDDVFAYTGKAETLRDMGKFTDALKQYDDTIQKFDNVVAYSGKAETLRDMGKFADALKQYDDTIEKFDDVFAYTGKAETLRDMGKFADALRQYDDTIQKFDNVVAYSGKAETLRDMGKFADALNQYDHTIQKFNDVFAYTGKAETLRDMGKFADALKQYDDTIQKFGDNVVAYNGKAETLRDMGKFTDAFKQYEDALSKYGQNRIAQTGRLKLLLETDQLENHLSEIIKQRYTTLSDYFDLHIYSVFLIKKGNWNEAQSMINIGLMSPYLQNRPYFKGLASYLKILNKEYTTALSYFDRYELNKPVENLLATHAFAASNQIEKAKEILHKLDIIERPVIKNTLNYISERYSLNGFKKSGKPQHELDSLIIEGEMKALLYY